MEVPAVTVRAVRLPPVTFKVAAEEAAVTTPPEMFAKPPDRTFNVEILAALRSVPETSVTLAVPAVRLAFAPVATVTLPRVALAVKVPAVTFERPVTMADPPVSLVMLLEAIEANVPPEAVKLPALVVIPIVPAEIVAVPAAPTDRLPILTPDTSSPPMTFARLVTDPELSVLFPPVTFRAVSVPPTRLSSPAELAVVMVPAEILAVAPV